MEEEKKTKTIFKYSLPTSHTKCDLHYRDESLNVAAKWKQSRAFFFFLLDRQAPAQLSARNSASVPSYVKSRGILTVDDGSNTNDHSDNNLYKV